MDTETFDKEFSILIEVCDDEDDEDYGLIDLTLISQRKDRPNICVILTMDESNDIREYFRLHAEEASLEEKIEGALVVLLVKAIANYGSKTMPLVASELSVIQPEMGEIFKVPLKGMMQRMFSYYITLLAYHYDIMLERLLNDESIPEDLVTDLLTTTFTLHYEQQDRAYRNIPIDNDMPEDLSYLRPTVDIMAYTQELKENIGDLKKVNVIASLESLMA